MFSRFDTIMECDTHTHTFSFSLSFSLSLSECRDRHLYGLEPWQRVCWWKTHYNSKTVQDRLVVSIIKAKGSHMCSVKWRYFRWPWVTP